MEGLYSMFSVFINGIFMLLVYYLSKLSNDKRDKFEEKKYKEQVNKVAKEFLSKYYFNLDSTNFKEKYFLKTTNDIFESDNSQLCLEGSLRSCIIKIINDYNNKIFYTNYITKHDIEVQNNKCINIWSELFLLNNDERNEVLRLLNEEIPIRGIKAKF